MDRTHTPTLPPMETGPAFAWLLPLCSKVVSGFIFSPGCWEFMAIGLFRSSEGTLGPLVLRSLTIDSSMTRSMRGTIN